MKLILLFVAISAVGCGTAPHGTSNDAANSSRSSGQAQNRKPGATQQGKQPGATNANGGENQADVPAPHASKNAQEGYQAGVGDDAADLDVANPKANPGATGQAAPAKKH